MIRNNRRARRLAIVAAGGAALLAAAFVPGATAHTEVPTNLQATVFATAPAGLSHPDDITRLDGLIYVTFQNNAGPDGSPAGSTSTVVAFDRHGTAVQQYDFTGRVDGLTADPDNDRVLATINEDLNSSFAVIRPDRATPVKLYTYSPSPAETGTDGTNGGTDSISVGDDGTIYVAHSNPDLSQPSPDNPAAVFTVSLHGVTATLTPLFGVNDTARVINPAPGAPDTAPLGMTDPDSNRFAPGPDGGMLLQDSQADSKIVIASHLDDGTPDLAQLNLLNAVTPTAGMPATPQIDDMVRVSGRGTLYVVDQAKGTISTVSTRHVEPGTWFVAQPAPGGGDQPNDPALGVVNLHTGVVTHVLSTFGSPKGLLFVPESHGWDGDSNN